MKKIITSGVAALVFAATNSIVVAQSDPHHSGAVPEAPMATAPQTTDQSGAMIQMMQQMMPMMEQMMGMMQSMQPPEGMAAHGGGTPMVGQRSEATQAYMDAMQTMDGPMMEGIMAEDPDVAFVKGMIPHHQGAIDMAKVVLEHGDDAKVKAWAEQIIKAQEAEIAEMKTWLEENQ